MNNFQAKLLKYLNERGGSANAQQAVSDLYKEYKSEKKRIRGRIVRLSLVAAGIVSLVLAGLRLFS